MHSVVLLAVALLLSSCKPYARQTSELWSTADKDLTLKLVAHQDNSSLATLVVCLAMDLARGDAEGEGDYATHSLYSRSDGETCFYTLHDTRETNTPYYFANPREVQTDIDNTIVPIGERKRGRNLLVSGVVIIGAATAIYMTTRSNSLFKKIIELQKIKSDLMSYTTLKSFESQVNTSVVIQFRDKLAALVKEFPDGELRTSLQKYLDGGDPSPAINNTTDALNRMKNDHDKARRLIMASMLGVGAVSAFVFIDELRNRKPRHNKPKPLHRKASALEELFKDHDMVTLSNEELWHTLRLLNSHLPARINPDLISLKGLFDVNIGRSM